MALISTEDAKAYLRVDSSDEDATVGILLASAIRLRPDSPLTGQSVIPAPLIWNFSAQTLMAMPYQTRPLILRKPEPLPRLALLGISSPTRSTP